MKKKIFFSVAIFSIIATTNSCREELVVNESAQNEVVLSEGSVKNGRLYFPNKESLTYAYDKVKNAEDEVIADYVDEKDIISLRPVVTESNENKIGAQLEERVNLLKNNRRYIKYLSSKGIQSKLENNEDVTDDIDDLEEIVGDDAYAAFLNSEAEIQVANDIYKYTDVGLFIVPSEKYQKLQNFLEVRDISDNLMYPTDKAVRENFIESMPSQQIATVSEDINYYNARIAPMDDPGEGGGSGGGGYNPPIGDPNVQMNNFINSLPNCGTYTTLLQQLFGDTDMCVDRYEDRRRVKTKAYNYNYVLVYNLGVKVKHQYKGWTGFWRKENVDEIRLGVLGAEFTYNYQSYFDPGPLNVGKTSIYTNNQLLKFNASSFNWASNGLTITNYNTAVFPKLFQDDIIIEQFGGNGLFGTGLNAAIAAGNAQLTSQKLHEYFWNYTVPHLGEWWQNLNKPVPVINNITLVYKALGPLGKIKIYKTHYDHQYNTDDVVKTFDWGFQVGVNIDSNGNVTPDTSGSALKKPEDFRVVMYAIVKKNGQWHGSKINTN